MTNPFLCLFHRDGNGPEETNLTEPLVTFPDPDTPPPVSDAVTLTGGSPSQLSSLNSLNNLHHGINQPINIPNIANLPAGQETMKFEQKKMTSASKTKVSTFLWVCEVGTPMSRYNSSVKSSELFRTKERVLDHF